MSTGRCARSGASDTSYRLGSGREGGYTIDHDISLVQRAFTAILSHFCEHGRAPHYVELAAMLDIGIEEARAVQREAASAAPASSCWLSHDTDYIEAWGPFSNVPTHVSIAVDGEERWFGL